MKEQIIAKQDELIHYYEDYIQKMNDASKLARIHDNETAQEVWHEAIELRAKILQNRSELSALKAEAEKEPIVTIPKWQMVHIEDVLRQTNNIHHSQKKETCFDRCVCKAWKWACDALGKEYSFEAEAEKEVSDENDFVQYVTNLLYNAYADGKQQINPDVFDEWIEKEMENMSEFYASHNLLARKVSDEILKKFHKYLVNWVVGYNPSDEFINELIEEFIKKHSLHANKPVMDEDINRWANEHTVTNSSEDSDLLQEMFRKGIIRGAKAMRDNLIKKG